MTDQQRDPEAVGPEAATEPEDAGAIDAADAADAAGDVAERHGGYVGDAEGDIETLTEADFDPLDTPREMPVDQAIAAATAETASRRRARTATPATRTAAPSVAEEAVHITDRVSSWFVIATVGVFVLLLAWALVAGRNGPISDLLATPRPVATEAPSVDPSLAPSLVPSVEPSLVPSVEPASPVPSAG